MAEIPVTINGVAYPKNKKDPPFPVTIVGSAWITGLSVGGGPMPGGKPPPLVIWGGGNEPFPTPPIAMPPPDRPPVNPPDGDGWLKKPPEEGGWGFHSDVGWVYAPGSGAGPKR